MIVAVVVAPKIVIPVAVSIVVDGRLLSSFSKLSSPLSSGLAVVAEHHLSHNPISFILVWK
jgi:hypothetical protein